MLSHCPMDLYSSPCFIIPSSHFSSQVQVPLPGDIWDICPTTITWAGYFIKVPGLPVFSTSICRAISLSHSTPGAPLNPLSPQLPPHTKDRWVIVSLISLLNTQPHLLTNNVLWLHCLTWGGTHLNGKCYFPSVFPFKVNRTTVQVFSKRSTQPFLPWRFSGNIERMGICFVNYTNTMSCQHSHPQTKNKLLL